MQLYNTIILTVSFCQLCGQISFVCYWQLVLLETVITHTGTVSNTIQVENGKFDVQLKTVSSG